MILYPAIDIRGGKAVRLTHGRFDAETVYHDDPLEAAKSWVEAGARYLHVVDLDGAKAGAPASIEHLRRIVAGTGVPVQYGGGLRTVDAVRDALRAGAERVIVGTAALRDVDFLDEIVERLRSARRRLGRRARREDRHGRLDRGDRHAGRRGVRAARRPRRRVVRLHRRRPRRRARGAVARRTSAKIAEAVRGRFLYAGGIGELAHLRGLRELRQVNLAGVICGKALYERRFTIAEAQAALDGKG